jgi:hypothetical protein
MSYQSATSSELSPPVEIDPVPFSRGTVHVVRDDLLLGGTKQRAIAPFLTDQAKLGFEEFVYASPPPGFAQVALASTCRQMGFRCTIFCDDMDVGGIPTATLHEFSRLAHSFGARIYTVPHLHQAERLAEEYCAERPGRMKLPLGFASENFMQYLKVEIGKQWQRIVSYLGRKPEAMWIPVGSATLGNVFRDVLPEEVTLLGVDIRVLPETDERIVNLGKRKNVKLYRAPELFADPVEIPPKIPSNAFYDAKLWRFIDKEGADGHIWWNVAR